MACNLTDRQNKLARRIVEDISSGKMEETFFAVWGTGLSPGQQPIIVWGDGDWRLDEFYFGDYNALAEEGYLRMIRDSGCPFPKKVQGYAPTDRYFNCTITKKLMDAASSNFAEEDSSPRHQHTLDVFISHSSKDTAIAEALIELIRAATNVLHERIRCTSVDGYRLPGGASTDEQLKQEVREARCFIALLTPDSLQSHYVLFELGARWGAKLPFVPLLAAGASTNDLKAPLSSLSALSCDSGSQLHQLVLEIAQMIDTRVSPAATYDRHLRHLMALAGPRGTGADNAAVELVLQTTQNLKHTKEALSPPATNAGRELLEMIQNETDNDERGLVEICGEITPGVTHFFPKLQYGGSPAGMKSRLFREGVAELVELGWLYPPEDNESTNTKTYDWLGH
jgi:hypothetical protein